MPIAIATAEHASELAGIDVFALGVPALVVREARQVVVVLSRSRDPRREVYLERCEGDGVPVVVRPSGGGAVVLSPGTVVASLLTRVAGFTASPEACFRRFCSMVASAFEDCGVSGAEQRGVSDLCFGERKVAGSALRLANPLVLYQVAILVAPDLSLIDRYLPLPSRQPAYRAGRSHADFLTTMQAQGFKGQIQEVVKAVETRLCEGLDELG